MRVLQVVLVVFFISNWSCKESESKDVEAETSEKVAVIEDVRHDLERIEPPHWWTGFKSENLQLLVHHKNIGNVINVDLRYPGVSLEEVHKAKSPNYLFLDLKIAKDAEAGQFNINFEIENDDDLIQTYELKSRKRPAEEYVGFDSSDVIYLITPDRFSNGDPANDIIYTPTKESKEVSTEVGALEENTIDRNENYSRHGGDISGIINHLDYVEDMGFTAIWPGPMLINDMPKGSYHGYAITDYYRVDPRFGTSADYIELSQKASKRGIKLIMDQIANHCGLEHWWMKDLPFEDWVNHQKQYEDDKDNWTWEKTTFSNHRRTANQDRYASQSDIVGLTDGWFVDAMPDLNQRNPFMAKYIIQNSIWWIETLKLGGIRQDTYPYPDKDFMADWAGAIMQEYPNFNIVGEEWSYNPLLIAYWQDGKENKDGYKSNLKSTMDFAMQEKVVKALNEEENWNTGLVHIYEGLANDFAYADPKNIMVFPDNHDMSRIYTQLDGDLTNTKMVLSYLLTLPRIPQIYYGTEILMDDFDQPGDHGLIRTDFPGGWEGDTVNAFTGEGLSDDQKEMQNYLKKLLNFRKQSKAIHNGDTVHFAPENGVYVLVRTSKDETVVHIINKNETPYELDLKRFEELNLKGKTLKNVITGNEIQWQDNLRLDSKGSLMYTSKTNE
ncbi:glycoside hydrolase family 13 protein [Winogradskyella maritima]|uniref:Glycoside hydrolase family 13 protein n=1 Tax=Winogradskyella maritima TaxID=1517766 RepID=A0ABV8AFX2_9FLAO|nr:glycoside hydrolase family 13 protein [Winogradskyella maritima]